MASVRAVNIADLRRLAQRRLPRIVFDYADGGAEDEITMRGNCRVFDTITFRPRSAVRTPRPDLRTTVLGTPFDLPFLLAPIGSTRMFYPHGEALAAAAAGAAGGIAIAIDGDSVRLLPPFDSDLEAERPPLVAAFDAACLAAPGLLISVPEYAHGIPGAFKNALDWTVGSGSLYAKPVGVLDVAPPGRGGYVRQALDHVFAAMQSDVVRYAVPIAAADRDAGGEIVGAAALASLTDAVHDFAARTGLHVAA